MVSPTNDAGVAIPGTSSGDGITDESEGDSAPERENTDDEGAGGETDTTEPGSSEPSTSENDSPDDGGVLEDPSDDDVVPADPSDDDIVPEDPSDDEVVPADPSDDDVVPEDPSDDGRGGPDEDLLDGCSPQAVFERNGCNTSGCHGNDPQAGLDLRITDLAPRMAGAESQSNECRNRLLIDPNYPERSLILQVVGAEPPPAGDDDSCQIVMPPGGSPLPNDDRECLARWVHDVAEDYRTDEDVFQPTPLAASMQKVKTLLTGGAVTQNEITQVAAATNERQALKALFSDWAQGSQYEAKMLSFFKVALQQRLNHFERNQFNNVRIRGGMRDRVRRVLEESFPRTALDLVERGEPFHQIATTKSWMVTTANLVLLAYGDQNQAQLDQEHTVFSQPNGRSTRLRRQIQNRAWFLEREEIGECTVRQKRFLEVMFGRLRSRNCEGNTFNRNSLNFEETILTENDFSDWRLVSFDYNRRHQPEELVPFYDVRRLRRASEVKTRLPRVGFFTTNAFFENWGTNEDNQFRVAVNQSLLAGLHIGFSASEQTGGVAQESVAEDHAEPGTSCNGCHQYLDPMRVYFSKAFNVRYQRHVGNGELSNVLPNMPSGFAFRGETREGGSLNRFGRMIAEHPQFALGWVQKLCFFANSDACDANDPEFQAIVRRFRNRGFNLKNMMLDLFSSHLVTGRAAGNGAQNSAQTISITRRTHLCNLLSNRTGVDNLCEQRRIRNVIGLIPDDDFARGAVDPTMPVLPNPVFLAAAEEVCDAVARSVVNNGSERFSPRDPDQALRRIVNELMGLVGQPDRASTSLEIITEHYNDARSNGANAVGAMRSAFSLGCMSPDVTGLGL